MPAMDQVDILLVLAQIAVTVAGFASLASVVGQSLSTAHPEVNSIRLRGLLHGSLAAMFLSIIAVALLRVPGLETVWAWRLASLLGFVIALIVGAGVIKRDHPRRLLPGYNRFTIFTSFGIIGVVTAALGCAATGLAGQYVASVFVCSMILILVGCSTAFVLVVTSFLESRNK
jgi:hypothetical protein